MLHSRSTKPKMDKLRELILCISAKSVTDEKYGKTKLNRILLAADIHSYKLRGRSISEAQYKALEYGPGPVGMKQILDEMEQNSEIAIQQVSRFGKPQERPINRRLANLEGFSGEDIALLDEVIDALRHSSSKELSDASHGIAWDTARISGKTIPLSAFLFKQKQRVSERLKQKGFALAKERGWEIYD